MSKPASDNQGSPDWYLAECSRAEQMLERGQTDQAVEAFTAILARLGEAPSFGRAVVLGRLGRCFYTDRRSQGALEHLRDAIGVAEKLGSSDAVKGLRAALHSDLGDALRAVGELGDAKKAYEVALKIGERLKDLRSQGVDLGRLGALALAEGNLEEALERSRAALALFRQIRERAMEAAASFQLGKILKEKGERVEAERHFQQAALIQVDLADLPGAARSWSQLALLNAESGKLEAAEECYQKAIGLERQIGDRSHLGPHLSELAQLLRHRPGRLADARLLAEEALAVAQAGNPAGADAWKHYGFVADLIEQQAAEASDGGQKVALQGRARDYRELEQNAPRIVATLARVPDGPSCGKVVILGQLGRCFGMGRRSELALAHFRDAMLAAEQLPASDHAKGLRGSLYSDLGDVLLASGQFDEARRAYDTALRISEELSDLRGQGADLRRMGALALKAGRQEEAEIWFKKATDIGLQLDSPGSPASGFQPGPERREADLASTVKVTLREDSTIDYVFATDLLVDGRRAQTITPWSEDASSLPDDARPMLLPFSRNFVDEEGAVHFHLPSAEPVFETDLGCTVIRRSRRDVAVSGSAEVLWRLIRAIDGVRKVAEILSDVPAGDRGPAGRNYVGVALAREEFDALLYTGCGVTGAMSWEGREVKLRAHPSSGALYAVEIYPVVFRVQGLEPAVYHYRAVDNVLEAVRRGIDPSSIVRAALPVEREMVAGAAALICLVGAFRRHERKYGEGGYRMLVAEAGHISQNLILAATAMGLSARPFGGVLDDLLNRELGLEDPEEQFLLGVLTGRLAPR
ncbi:MAG: tetratricopeptide repeat protein [Betaproteobacteria bacterium]|nr:MAG: tetratricopeptide repeat protein [Betaproteobacteria bacterium]